MDIPMVTRFDDSRLDMMEYYIESLYGFLGGCMWCIQCDYFRSRCRTPVVSQ